MRLSLCFALHLIQFNIIIEYSIHTLTSHDLSMLINAPFYKLMLLTNRQQTPLADYLQFIRTCASSGITAVQLREKKQPIDYLLAFGQQLKSILDPLNIPLIVNDDIELALELNASGVHLGQSDGDARKARQILGPNKMIGVSIDSEENLISANDLPIDYVGIGAIYKTANKHNVTTIWGIKRLQQIAAHSKHPIVGIGGIDIHNAADVVLSGAEGIAVIGALHDTCDPSLVTQQLRNIIDKGDHNHVA